MKHLLQRIVFPKANEASCAALYYHRNEFTDCAYGKSPSLTEEFAFNTWMNLFAAKKWFHYSALDDCYLGFHIKGNFSIEIIGSNLNAAYGRLDEKIYFQEYEGCDNEQFLHISNPEHYDALYCILRYAASYPCQIISLGWYTNTAPKVENKLAIVTCTYRRETYIHKTVRQFTAYLASNPDLRKRMHLYVIDNGQTLEAEIENEYVTLFPNINAGGAGGFGRGLIEVCRSDENYTRCLFIDDDVDIIPESFYRTLVLADYLKEQYRDAIINGSMLDLYNKLNFFENMAVQETDGLWIHSYHEPCDLRDYNNILRVNHVPEEVFRKKNAKVSGAWFYCSFPVDADTKNQLPLPIFIRGDDAEWGWRRHGQAFIQLNGICIWHAPFVFRVSNITDRYYFVRNMFLVHSLYTADFGSRFEQYYRRDMNYLLDTYDYTGARLMLKAFADILKGSAVFNEDPVELMHNLQSIAKEDETAIDDLKILSDVARENYIGSGKKALAQRAVRKIFRCFPWAKTMLKKDAVNKVSAWYPPTEAFLMKKQVEVYNLLTHRRTVRRYDKQTECIIKKEFEHYLQELKSRFSALQEDYRENYHRLTSYDFWIKYLKLK